MGYWMMYADKARLQEKVPLFYNINLNKMRHFTCVFIVMTGNVTFHDIELALEQMQVMKQKLILLQDYSGGYHKNFSFWKVPVVKYAKDTNRVKGPLKYLCTYN